MYYTFILSKYVIRPLIYMYMKSSDALMIELGSRYRPLSAIICSVGIWIFLKDVTDTVIMQFLVNITSLIETRIIKTFSKK